MYSLGMVPIVDTSQPNNPNFDVWYKQLMCPWNVPDDCGASDDELGIDEASGVLVCAADANGGPSTDPAKCAPNQHPQYAIFPTDPMQNYDKKRRTMSCALCGRLRRTFPAGAPIGAPDLINASIGLEYSLDGVPEDEHHQFTAWWDMHAFGAWLANMAARNGKRGIWDPDQIVSNINLFKASNGEEIHGYLWQSLRLLAYDTGTLEGNRLAEPPHKTAVNYAHKVCQPTWWVSSQSLNDCAHAAGHVLPPRIRTIGHRSYIYSDASSAPITVTPWFPHHHHQGYFYFFFDIGKAVLACTDPDLIKHAPNKDRWANNIRMRCIPNDRPPVSLDTHRLRVQIR